MTDVDGNQYIDYALGYGPLLLGHTPEPVIDAVRGELKRGLRTGGVTSGEARLAELVSQCVPSSEMTTFLSSGTEAVQVALRIARAATGRGRIVKFRSHYHGWADSMHVSNSPGTDAMTTGGQDPKAVENVILLDWGDIGGLVEALDDSVAAVIMEPAAINAGCFEPDPGFLEHARQAVTANGSLLIFDEVITGFRLGLGGAQECYGIMPDLTVLGKVLGAGLPISAVTGSREAMDPVVTGRVLHRGTYNGNPLSVAAGIACLEFLSVNALELYPRMEQQGAALAKAIRESAAAHGKPIAVNHIGTCLQFFISSEPVTRLRDLAGLDRDRTLDFTELLVRRGIMTLPRGLMYLSTEHTDADIEATIDVFDAAIGEFVK